MIRKSAKLHGLAFCIFAFTAAASAFADGANREPPAEVKAAFESCGAELGLSRPAEGVRPSEADRAKMRACVEEKGIKLPEHGRGSQPGHHQNFAAMKSCLEAAGVQLPAPPAAGTRPVFSDAIKAAMDACRAQADRQTSSAEEPRLGVGDSSSDVSE